MRIFAFFLNGCEYGKIMGGAERRFLEVSVYLRKLGVQIFALEYQSFQSEKWAHRGYFAIKVKRRFPNNSFLRALRAAFLGLVNCLKYKCDIVYVTSNFPWGETPWTGLIAPYLVSRLLNKPLAIIFHHAMSQDLNEKNPIKLSAYRNAACMAVSQNSANDFKKCFTLKNITVVGNGIDTEPFRQFKIKTKKFDAVFLGRVSEDKGIFDLLNAWKNIVANSPSARLLLIGGVDYRIAKRLHQTILNLHIENNVTVTGFVTDEKVIQLLKASKIFVLPSKEEGFSLVVAEAMAAGLPCIISDLPALREVYSSAAIFVETGNTEKITEAIQFLLLHPEYCKMLEQEGQKLIENLTWENVALKEYGVLQNSCWKAAKKTLESASL